MISNPKNPGDEFFRKLKISQKIRTHIRIIPYRSLEVKKLIFKYLCHLISYLGRLLSPGQRFPANDQQQQSAVQHKIYELQQRSGASSPTIGNSAVGGRVSATGRSSLCAFFHPISSWYRVGPETCGQNLNFWGIECLCIEFILENNWANFNFIYLDWKSEQSKFCLFNEFNFVFYKVNIGPWFLIFWVLNQKIITIPRVFSFSPFLRTLIFC